MNKMIVEPAMEMMIEYANMADTLLEMKASLEGYFDGELSPMDSTTEQKMQQLEMMFQQTTKKVIEELN